MSRQVVKHMRELGFTVVASPKDYAVEFTAYAILGEDESGSLCWRRAGSSTFDPVERLEESEPYLHGEVKWDGCSNWHFDEQDRVMLHGCSREDLSNIGALLAACWDWTGELLPKFSP